MKSTLKKIGCSEQPSPEILFEIRESMTKEVIETVQVALASRESPEYLAKRLKKKYRINGHIGKCITEIIKTNNECCTSVVKEVCDDARLLSKLTHEQIAYPLGYKRSYTLNDVKGTKDVKRITIDKLGKLSLFSQLKERVPLSCVDDLRTSDDYPWKVSYKGEWGVDLGGLARDFFTHVCEEVLRPDMGLFQQTPNGKNGEGPNQNAVIPSLTADHEDLEYVGVLMGLAYWYQLPQPFEFPNLVWKCLSTGQIQVQDLCDIDMQLSQLISMPSKQQNQVMLVDIWGVPWGGKRTVGTTTQHTVTAWITKQITALTGVLEPLARGVRRIIPSGFGFYGPLELKMEICGPNTCPMSRLANVVQVWPEEWTDLVHSALESLTDDERFGFLAFVTGSKRLPVSQDDIVRVRAYMEHVGLPVAHTCFNSLDIGEYDTPGELAKDIRVCLKWGGDFGVA